MAYIHTLTKQYPVSEAEIRAANPQVSFPSPFVPPAEYQWVFPAPPPEHDPLYKQAVETEPVFANTIYSQTWKLVDRSPEQIAADLKARVPKVVTRAQFILALLQLDLLDEVEAAIAVADRETQINYKERLEFHRDYPLVTTMAAALGKSEEEVDALFTLAATK